MTAQELKDIFLFYLKREPNENEYLIHGYKDLNLFTEEVKLCQEFTNLKNKNPNKIAFILSGHIRKNSVLSGILKYSSHYDIDVFIHTWDTRGIKGTEMNLDNKKEYDLVLSEIKKIPNVKSFIIENNNDYINSLKEDKNIKYFNYSSPEKFIKSQLYSINKSFNLLEDYVNKTKLNYDLVVKLRFDLNLTYFDLNQHTVSNCINNKIIFFPNKDCNHSHPDYGTSCWACDNMYYKHGLLDVHIFEHTNIVCDVMAYGSFKSMKKYCSLYNVYDKLNKQNLNENLKMLKNRNANHITEKDGDYKLTESNYQAHIESVYYYNCSYPERLLMQHLKDYMLIESTCIKVSLIR